jgi:hypothetical protein
MSDKLFAWVDEGGKKRLKRVGSWSLLFKVNWMVVVMVLTVLFCFLYMKTADRECHEILQDPSLYCPCWQDSVHLSNDSFVPSNYSAYSVEG